MTDDGAIWFRENFTWHPRIARFGADGSFREYTYTNPDANYISNIAPLVAEGNRVRLGFLHGNDPAHVTTLDADGRFADEPASGCLSAGPDIACFPNSQLDIRFQDGPAAMSGRRPVNPNSAVMGPDGNMWFTDVHYCLLGRIHPDGRFDVFTKGLTRWRSGPQFIAVGPDGNLWFTEVKDRIGRVTPAGIITEFSLGIPHRSSLGGIVAGPDGALWFTLYHGMVLGRITTAGAVTLYHDLVYPSDGHDFDPVAVIVRDAKGRLYWNEGQAGRIARLTFTKARSPSR